VNSFRGEKRYYCIIYVSFIGGKVAMVLVDPTNHRPPAKRAVTVQTIMLDGFEFSGNSVPVEACGHVYTGIRAQ
jgi:hypothetical protein